MINLYKFKDIDITNGKYRISENGDVYSCKNKKFLKSCVDRYGYKNVDIYIERKRKTCYVHRLVAMTFIENPLMLDTVNHKDGDKLNNHVTNLEWLSKADNTRHAFNNNLVSLGSNRKNSKLNENDVIEIRKLILQGNLSFKKIGEKYNVYPSTIHEIKTGKNWRRVQ
jgi:hypothetical protein